MAAQLHHLYKSRSRCCAVLCCAVVWYVYVRVGLCCIVRCRVVWCRLVSCRGVNYSVPVIMLCGYADGISSHLIPFPRFDLHIGLIRQTFVSSGCTALDCCCSRAASTRCLHAMRQGKARRGEAKRSEECRTHHITTHDTSRLHGIITPKQLHEW